MELAEKNYILSEIKKYDKQIAGLSWCAFGFVLIKSNKKNYLFLIISLIITVLLCIPLFIYLSKCNKRKRLVEQYVFKEYIECQSEIILSSIYSEIDYSMIRNYVYSFNKNEYHLNADKTRLSRIESNYEIEDRLIDLRNELIVLHNSNSYKSLKRRKEINKQIVFIIYHHLNKQTSKEICDYCSSTLSNNYQNYNTIYQKYVDKVLKKA